MARGLPSMTALLGLLAIAGYQNREKLAEMFGGAGQRTSGDLNDNPGSERDRGATSGASGGGLGSLLGGLGGASAGSVLSGGIGEVIERFRQSGQGDVADSWVAQGPNRPLSERELEQAIGPEVLDDLSRHTGLSRDDLLSRLTRELPEAVDRFTPAGRIPSEDDFRTF
jgi:uncharacterized protein YidB (DUF937 family)